MLWVTSVVLYLLEDMGQDQIVRKICFCNPTRWLTWHSIICPMHSEHRPFHTEIGKFRNIQCVNHGEEVTRLPLLGASTIMTTPHMWYSITHSTRNCWRVEVNLLFTMLKTTPALLWKVCFLSENFNMKMSITRWQKEDQVLLLTSLVYNESNHRGLLCDLISSQVCKSSYSQLLFWFPCHSMGTKMSHNFLFSSYHNTKLQLGDKNIRTHT